MQHMVGHMEGWEVHSGGMQSSSDGHTVTCVQEQENETYAAAVGRALPRDGTSEFTITIVNSDGNGGGMLIGITESVRKYPKVGAWGKAWGVAPWNGNLFGFSDARSRDKSPMSEIRGGALMRGDMRGTASGTKVHVRIDMQQAHLYFKVNTADWVLASDEDGKALVISVPCVRPFVRCTHAGDVVMLGDVKHVAAARPAKAEPIDLTFREKELLLQVQGLKEQLDSSRAQLAAEREVRIRLQRERDIAVEEAVQARRSTFALDKGGAQGHATRAKEVEAQLLREAMIENERERQQALLQQIAADRFLAAAAGAGVDMPRNRWQALMLQPTVRNSINARTSIAAFGGSR